MTLGVQAVSVPDASPPAAIRCVRAQSVQTWLLTYSFSAQVMAAHATTSHVPSEAVQVTEPPS
jgi:hypothetical protein